MVRTSPAIRRRSLPLSFGYGLLLVSLCGTSLLAQRPAHYAYRSNQPPGSIGASQVARGVAPAGFVQPVRIQVPEQASVSVAGEGETAGELRVGLVVGQPYRLKVTHFAQGKVMTLYPSVEVIGRLHPPEGQKNRFPIPIDIAAEDIELAESGSMVVRVIYLENPQRAFPESERREQRYLDILPAEDPLQIADELGRPMAILRIGSRKPLNGDGDAGFQFGSPPVEHIAAPAASEPTPLIYGDAVEVQPGPVRIEPAPVVDRITEPTAPAPTNPFVDDVPQQ